MLLRRATGVITPTSKEDRKEQGQRGRKQKIKRDHCLEDAAVEEGIIKGHFSLKFAAVEVDLRLSRHPAKTTEMKRIKRESPWKTLQLRRAWG